MPKKILYGMGKRFGAAFQFIRIKSSLKEHTIKSCGFYSFTKNIPHINFLLDSLYVPLKNKMQHFHDSFEEQVKSFNPDLIISDDDIMTARIANKLKIPLWYCSPTLLLEAAKIPNKQVDYAYFIDENLIRKIHLKFPPAEKRLVYSPLGKFNFIDLKKGYEWVEPEVYQAVGDSNVSISTRPKLNEYLKYFNNWKPCDSIVDFKPGSKIISSGETVFLADALHNMASQIIICPTLNDIECITNALFWRGLGIATDLGQIELTQEKYCFEKLSTEIDKNNMLDQFKNLIPNKNIREFVEEL